MLEEQSSPSVHAIEILAGSAKLMTEPSFDSKPVIRPLPKIIVFVDAKLLPVMITLLPIASAEGVTEIILGTNVAPDTTFSETSSLDPLSVDTFTEYLPTCTATRRSKKLIEQSLMAGEQIVRSRGRLKVSVVVSGELTSITYPSPIFIRLPVAANPEPVMVTLLPMATDCGAIPAMEGVSRVDCPIRSFTSGLAFSATSAIAFASIAN